MTIDVRAPIPPVSHILRWAHMAGASQDMTGWLARVVDALAGAFGVATDTLARLLLHGGPPVHPSPPHNQVTRLRQFLDWDIPANLVSTVFLAVLYCAFRAPVLAVLACGVLLNTALVIWARQQVAQGRLERGITVTCLGLWIIALSVSFSIPLIHAFGVVLAVWPVALALPYVTGHALRRLMALSTLVSLAAVASSFRSDQPTLQTVVPDWLVHLTVVFTVPLGMGFVFLLLWHHSSHLNETLAQTRVANSALRESEQLLESRVAQRTSELAEARDHALAATRAKSAFLANMSHELRTPLNAILGYTELVLDGIYGEPPDRIREILERVDVGGHHLLGLINDVLDLSKIEVGQLVLSVGDYSLHEIVRTVCLAMEPLAREKGLALTVTVPDTLPVGTGDERRITQVLLNLVGNGIKFTDAGEVCVRVAVRDDEFSVSVADTGPGIAEVDRERVFGAFQQADSSSRKEMGGTGLGLAIARRIVELHGGHLWLESASSSGATFSFTLPSDVGRPRLVLPGSQEATVA